MLNVIFIKKKDLLFLDLLRPCFYFNNLVIIGTSLYIFDLGAYVGPCNYFQMLTDTCPNWSVQIIHIIVSSQFIDSRHPT
jgi:hypothetical protein